LRQIPLFAIDSATSSKETLINGWTSLKNFGSKSTGTPAALELENQNERTNISTDCQLP
jgi:hypothetical protein